MHLDPDMTNVILATLLGAAIAIISSAATLIITRKDSTMTEFTDALDAATATAIAKINGAGADTQAIADLTKKNADLQAQIDATNADITKNADALNAAVNPVAPAPVVEPAPQPDPNAPVADPAA